MDLSTIVYIVGALAYALLRRQSKPKPAPDHHPGPGPVVFPPSKAPLPMPSVNLPAPPFTGRLATPLSTMASVSPNPTKPTILSDSEISKQPNDQPEPFLFQRPDRNEWRRAIVLSTLLEPRYDKGLHQ